MEAIVAIYRLRKIMKTRENAHAAGPVTIEIVELILSEIQGSSSHLISQTRRVPCVMLNLMK